METRTETPEGIHPGRPECHPEKMAGFERESIVDRPVRWDDERRSLSLEYMRERHGLDAEEPVITPVMIVVHATHGHTFESAFHTFNPVRLKGRKFLRRASPLNVSAHFVVDRDGTIYRLLPETVFARHVVGLNHCAIGIENVGGVTRSPLTERQVESNIRLIRHLACRFSIRFVLGHHEYLAFSGTDWWKESSPEYFTVKPDPGEAFMTSVRNGLDGLDLEVLPKK